MRVADHNGKTRPVTDLTYLFYIDDDVVPLQGNLTLGNHLDNDIVIAGEDVADFHVRVSISDRGPELIPLGQATVNVNGYEHDTPVCVIIGDIIGIGADSIQVGIEEEVSEFQVEAWRLVPEVGSDITIEHELTIGRSDEATITIADSHVSRIHARIVQKNKHIWFQDLRSANGSRVNGQRLQGGVRLFHGDQISVDRHSFQLVGVSDELTPINRYVDPLRGTDKSIPTSPSSQRSVNLKEGAHLRSLQDGVLYYLNSGNQKIGTSSECEVRWMAESAVTYAELDISSEGFVLTRVAGHDTVFVNGESQDRKRLTAGDTLRFGESEFEFVIPQPPDASESVSPISKYAVPIAIAGFILLAGLLLLL